MGRQIRQKPIRAVEQYDAQILAADAPVVLKAGVQEVDQLSRRFHAAESAADNDETRQPAPMFGIGLQLCLLQSRDDAIAQKHRISEGLQRQAVVAHASDDVEVRVRAARQYQLVIGDRAASLVEVVDDARGGGDLSYLDHAYEAAVHQ